MSALCLRVPGAFRVVGPLLVLVCLPGAPMEAQVFRSSHAANLPTTTTLPAGDLLFEISHRFTPPVSAGADAFWGLDGPVINRLGLAYAVQDAALVGVRRSNLADNVELWGQARLVEGSGQRPFALGLAGAVAWNTDPPQGVPDNALQLYLQGMVDVRLADPVAIGIVPTLLRNPRIQDAEAANAFVLGTHAQVNLSRGVSAVAEWIFSEERPGQAFDSGSFGVEIMTRGHFFKLFLTNQVRMNPSQVLGGSPVEFTPDEWRLGFNITRRIVF